MNRSPLKTSLNIPSYWFRNTSTCNYIPEALHKSNRYLAEAVAKLRKEWVLNTAINHPIYNGTSLVNELKQLPLKTFTPITSNDLFHYKLELNNSTQHLYYSFDDDHEAKLNCALTILSSEHFNRYAHEVEDLITYLNIVFDAAVNNQNSQLRSQITESYKSKLNENVIFSLYRVLGSYEYDGDYAELLAKAVNIFSDKLNALCSFYHLQDPFLLLYITHKNPEFNWNLEDLANHFTQACNSHTNYTLSSYPLSSSSTKLSAEFLTFEDIHYIREKIGAREFLTATSKYQNSFANYSLSQARWIADIIKADFENHLLAPEDIKDALTYLNFGDYKHDSHFYIIVNTLIELADQNHFKDLEPYKLIQLANSKFLSLGKQQELIKASLGTKTLKEFFKELGLLTLTNPNIQKFLRDDNFVIDAQLVNDEIDGRGIAQTSRLIINKLFECSLVLVEEHTPKVCQLFNMTEDELFKAYKALNEDSAYNIADIIIVSMLKEHNQLLNILDFDDHFKDLGEIGFRPIDLASVIMMSPTVEFMVESLLDRKIIDLNFNLLFEELEDYLIYFENIQKFIPQTSNPLYSLLQEGASTEDVDPSKINIALSHGESFWSNTYFSTVRLLKNMNPEFEFYLLTERFLEDNPSVLQIFDGIINPGAADSYPTGESVFKINENWHEEVLYNNQQVTNYIPYRGWTPKLDTEVIYQKLLNHATKEGMPTLGACAGYQNLALSRGAYLKPIDGYNSGHHEITILPKTMVYFNSLSSEQKYELLIHGSTPAISYKGVTAHHYVPQRNLLGDELELGAVSEHGEAMSACDLTGMHCGTQYHPEFSIKYANMEQGDLYQFNLIDSFLSLAKIHHLNRTGESELEPAEFTSIIRDSLHNNVCPIEMNELIEHL